MLLCKKKKKFVFPEKNNLVYKKKISRGTNLNPSYKQLPCMLDDLLDAWRKSSIINLSKLFSVILAYMPVFNFRGSTL